jgi:hypothetical protein
MPTSSTRYRVNEAEFALDSAFVDESINIFTGQPPVFDKTSLVLTRARPDTSDLLAYATGQIRHAESAFPEYQLAVAREKDVGGVKCHEVVFRWKSDRGLLHQWQLYVPIEDSILVATFTALDEITDAQRDVVAAFVRSLRLRD